MNKLRNSWISKIILVVSPAFCYLVFEMITGNLLKIAVRFAVWNLLFYYLIYFLLGALFNRIKITNIVLNTLFTLLAVAEYYVVAFRSRPIMLGDIMAWKTASTVAGAYQYTIMPAVAAGVLLMLGWNVLSGRLLENLPKGRKRMAFIAFSVTLSAAWCGYFYSILIPAKAVNISMWNPIESYEERGYLLCTMRMAGYLHVKKPLEYQRQAVKQLYDQWVPSVPSGETVPVNIICIMNESWSDLSVIAPFETDRPYFSYYQALSDNCIKGNAIVPIFGTMTSNSEYEFLTGNSMAFAPVGSVPYQIYMKGYTDSLVGTLKSQGYQAAALHPYPGDNWNRTRAYQSMGFDLFLDESYFVDSPRIRGYVSDKGCYDKLIRLTEDANRSEKLFLFLVTMQNHGGYAQEYQADVRLTGLGGFSQTEQYLSMIKESDQALEYLIEHYSQVDQPTLIMMFGDHQPSVEDEFYETLFGKELSELAPEEHLKRYQTPYLIWTNYENNLTQQGDISILYLSGLVLQGANLPMSRYQQFLAELQAEAPIIHMTGYYDRQRVWQSWTNWRTKESYALLHQLEWFQYYRMFDRGR